MEPNVQSPFIWYIMLCAVDTFYNEFNRYPGIEDLMVCFTFLLKC